MSWARQYQIADDDTRTIYARWADDYYDDALWILEEGKFWINTQPYKIKEDM